jgi:hypothetical protein
VLAVVRMREEIEIPYDWEETEFPWYVADAHTGPGKIAKAVAARKLGIDPDRLWTLWFMFESAEVDQKSEENYWWDRTLEEESKRLGFATVEDARRGWGRYRETVKELVIWAMNK